ncbi:MAG: tyrosine-type recombinase/integrase [Verrucomicrobia bacterium]|nr:tyrosine-type recombinase/integrase [Verrucomicrobiota bacterium]
MASLRHLSNSPYWIACFTLPDGTRTQRSTRVPVSGAQRADFGPLQKLLDDLLGAKVTITEDANADGALDAREAKRLAQRIAAQFEDAARDARAGRLTESQARKVIADIYALGNKDALQSSTIKDYCEAWLKRKELEANERTHQRYGTAIAHFLEHAGNKASRDIAHLTVKEITGLRDHLAKALSPNSANYTVKVLRAMLNQARRDGFVETNEASRATLIQRVRKFERRPFTLAELKRILAVANDEWRGMILTGLYTGLRLGDVATLTWANLDLQQQELIVTTQKTGRRQIIPLAKALLRHLESLPAGDNPAAPLFPEAYESKTRNPHGGPLSNQFYEILVAAGLAKPRTHKSRDIGRDAKRQLNEISFHSLRHTATSRLKNAGVSDVIARDIIGHDSAAVSASYTHIDQQTKRGALAKLPDVTK